MRHRVAMHEDEDGFAASVPGLPGCWSQGDTELEALENTEAAIREYLEVVDELIGVATVRVIEAAV